MRHNKRQTEPKMTQTQIIALLIKTSAEQLANNWPSTNTEFINSKNKPTLALMVKHGLVEFAQYSDSTIQFTARGIAEYAMSIRCHAQYLIHDQMTHPLFYGREERTRGNNIMRLRFTVPLGAKKEYWTNSTEFTFIDWHYIDDYGNRQRVNCNYETDCAVNTESDLQGLEQDLVRIMIARIPVVEICAIRN